MLLSDSLEEKLAAPTEPLTDDVPGPALITPEAPGRPLALRMAERGDRVELPPERELHREEPRAVLLHLFANHELLATELMALAILKFPDAPRAFRKAVREGTFQGPTNGVCPGFMQCNLVVLPQGQHAFDFLLFCQRNKKACPLVEVCDVGSPYPNGVARDADLRTDVPK